MNIIDQQTFRTLSQLKPGEKSVYYIGWTGKIKPSVAKAAHDLYEKGVVTLVQKALPSGEFQYIAIGKTPENVV
jgi:hypothetical protein